MNTTTRLTEVPIDMGTRFSGWRAVARYTWGTFDSFDVWRGNNWARWCLTITSNHCFPITWMAGYSSHCHPRSCPEIEAHLLGWYHSIGKNLEQLLT